ncbi:hypothetical protein JG687_00018396 [Phytophthora cactorum]|uniref:Uncharacterized protein n=1 Tax=Phytophthora cactorum TaxID=29920 RepID=A0A8T1TLS9_9STRA|nr:hypothetical protein JG687_00018396 [Phytophthora cactorum]
MASVRGRLVARACLEHVPAQLQGHLVRAQINSRVTVPSRFKDRLPNDTFLLLLDLESHGKRPSNLLRRHLLYNTSPHKPELLAAVEKIKHPVETSVLLSKVANAWESENPMARNEIYLWLIKIFANVDEFGPRANFAQR